MKNKSQSNKEWRDKNKDRILEYDRLRNPTPVGRYKQQKAQAKRRGINWELTFSEWWGLWLSSGKWEQRGYRKGQYCMCRYGDIGPYSLTNVKIDTTDNNKSERHGKSRSS